MNPVKYRIFFFLLCLLLAAGCQRPPTSIEGIVSDSEGPIVGARVRLRTGDHYVITDSEGAFSLDELETQDALTLTAWAPGYFIAAAEDVSPQDSPITITLTKHTERDHPDYEWVSAFAAAGQEANCQNCHSDGTGLLPFEEWQLDAHSNTLNNHRFINLYLGKDLEGNASPPTRYAQNRDYGPFPLPPNPQLPYYGPGYKLDFPDTDGNCATCHAPAAAINAPYETNPMHVEGVAKEGITCDFCHKIWDVWLDEATGLPQPNMPGVLSYEFRRPGEDHQFFAGPFDDVAPGEDTYSPIQTESAYCAPCHFGVFWDTTIYNSYGEWLNSPFSDPIEGQTCQDCHMPTLGTEYFAVPEAGGLARDPNRIRSHKMLGITDDQFMQEAASVHAVTSWQDQVIQLEVEVTNDNTGHKLPTDSPLRNLILLVQASDASGQPLELNEGPRLPDLAGSSSGEPGHYAGQPGRLFALVLQERWTGVSPTAAYWNPVIIIEDSRLGPRQKDHSSYRFVPPAEGDASLSVKLIFRRAFAELAEQKGWDLEDQLLDELTFQLSRP